MKARNLIFILLLFVLNISYSGNTRYVSVNSFCLKNNFKYQENLKLNYIEILTKRGRFKLFVTMPYISYKGQVYYLNSNLKKGAQGQWYMSYETIDKMRKILGTSQKVNIKLPDQGVTEQWIHENKTDKLIVKKDPVKKTSLKKQSNLITVKNNTRKDPVKKDEQKQLIKKSDTVPVEGFIPLNAVIIDAGHGGRDPGAIGRNGIKEKDVVLSISKYLNQYLKADKDLNIFMTRNKDVYVSLEKRTQYASQKAKKYNPLFVSIHGNMSLSRKSSGIEVFSLSDKASDDQALQVEMMENEGFHTQDIKKTDALFSIIANLIRDGLTKESSYLAKRVFSRLCSYTGAKKRGLKKANFYVLKYNTVPAVLVEVGFLSHSQEGKKLATAAYRKKIARGLYYGIKGFVQQYNKTKGYSQ